MPNGTPAVDPRQQTSPPPPGAPPAPPPGYITPEQQARREAENRRMDEGIPVGSNLPQRHAAEDATANAPINGHFSMNPAELKAIQAEWADVAKALNDLGVDAQRLVNVHKPADEDASNLQIKAASDHATLYMQKLQEQFDYADGYAKALQQSIDKMQTQDRAAADAARNAAKGQA
ncbi:MAG TPA: hypothetical protein VJX66_03795 [Amycolatopsis sp.]|nr:hypothetical protein [Amycolatopsis sp.]